MKLTLEGIKDCELWNKAGITLPGYDVEKVSQKAKRRTKVGTFWNRKYFPYFYWWHCRWSFWKKGFLTEQSHV